MTRNDMSLEILKIVNEMQLRTYKEFGLGKIKIELKDDKETFCMTQTYRGLKSTVEGTKSDLAKFFTRIAKAAGMTLKEAYDEYKEHIEETEEE